ncbi:MAG: penicillin-binding protein activator [Nitrosomonadales bacterium]|nr:MAG: penicillin-binding protein activator [Nitrosomonadales bacterium]
MIQRLSAFLLLLTVLAPGALAADARKLPATTPAQPASQPAKSPDERFLDSRACLQRGDTPCAQVALAGINPASPYAKILDAQLAAVRGDLDTALRLLIPLQAETGLLPQAYASLHATLAQAYAGQENLLRTVEQRTLAEPFLDGPEEIRENQAQLWNLLARQPRELLVEMRGESPNPVVQGWVDLALAYSAAGQGNHDLDRWRAAYPDHPANEELLRMIAAAAAAAAPAINAVKVNGKVALLLPLDAPDYAAAAQAVLAGFKTAHSVVGYPVNIQIYPTDGTAEGTVLAYQHALLDGAQFVVGPLVRIEVETLAAGGLVTAPTLALNQPESGAKLPEHLLAYGLAVEIEARQAAQAARHAGLQTATVLCADTPLARRMAQAFILEWRAQDGGTPRQLDLPADDKLDELKANMAAQPTDVIFLAADASDARRVRPHLDPSIPTFGISHIYDGDAASAQNQTLNAVHFVDMPWLLDSDNSEFALYRPNAAEFGKGWPQRWFALGADAYRLLPFLSGKTTPGKPLLHGLSGNISLGEDGRFTRDLITGQFRADGVAVENLAP